MLFSFFEGARITTKSVARHGKLPPRRHEELPLLG
jgi:hypothetical protein